ncbi:MAG: hypothetical protein H0W88_00605 [Parachlamydiaceae bacterium]|nr:hypothetical protein [Parachlamydiaceae bacterium]
MSIGNYIQSIERVLPPQSSGSTEFCIYQPMEKVDVKQFSEKIITRIKSYELIKSHYKMARFLKVVCAILLIAAVITTASGLGLAFGGVLFAGGSLAYSNAKIHQNMNKLGQTHTANLEKLINLLEQNDFLNYAKTQNEQLEIFDIGGNPPIIFANTHPSFEEWYDRSISYSKMNSHQKPKYN